MENPTNYSLEIIVDPVLLTECFKLRYEIYLKTFPKAVRQTLNHVESDQFDHRSIHIGLFNEGRTGRSLVGYTRFILPEKYSGRYADYLIASHELYPITNVKAGANRLHLQEDLPPKYQRLIESFCLGLVNQEKIFIETSRFIVRDNHRGLAVSSFFTKGMIFIAKKLKIDYAFFSCSESHMPYYLRSGLTKLPGIETHVNQRFGERFVVFGTELDKIHQNSFNIVMTDKQERINRNMFKIQCAA